MRSVLFLAAENGALPGGKVGGVGDVVRDLPKALVQADWRVRVATPSYGILHRLSGSNCAATLSVPFRGEHLAVEVWELPSHDGVDTTVLHHELFEEQGAGRIYFGGDADRPFATDATKFALFSIAAASWIRSLEQAPDVVHLHDWHAALYLPVTKYIDEFASQRDVRTVFTIHNLAYQGTRPLDGDESSLAAWFPGMTPDFDAIRDPAHANCINPMAAAIRLADKVSTVSPTYAQEICRPSDPSVGFIGGEGLETLLQAARDDGRLGGVLNGCNYSDLSGRRPGWQRLLAMLEGQLHDWQIGSPASEAHELALERVAELPKRRPHHVMTSIGRLVAQKATLLLLDDDSRNSSIERIASECGRDAVIIILGSGETAFEERMLEVARRLPNLVFLCGYSEVLAEPLYHAGDLFLMPSSFEPCGISQMLAMRRGQPVVAHRVGGLGDTIEDDVTGFLFSGETPDEQVDAFVETTLRALSVRADDPLRWQELQKAAAAERFDWAASARQTIKILYED
jgi:starch synthase